MKICNRYTNKVIFECEKGTKRETVLEAIENKAPLSWANLSGIDLSRVDLSWANLSWADLPGTKLFNTKFEKTKILYRDKIVEVSFKEVKYDL
uniref:Pentapeptide repeat-containing protein n=1 Tax=viral metagenome TaxID=1070528 RepID=A0A6H1ZC09_9ZZZZ